MNIDLRNDGRGKHQAREIKLVPGYIKHVAGSVLIEQGDTRLVCTATHETRVPPFLRNSNKGWIQAEYAMLPGSTGSQQRSNRERNRVNSRNIEIQRFLGRAFRTTIDLKKIVGVCITIDNDVIQADGGTRCASINGGMVALGKALKHLVYENVIPHPPQVQYIAAVSIGVKDKDILVDLNYIEDSNADADINIVSNENGNIVEVQAFGEEQTIPLDLFQEIIKIGVNKNLDIIKQLKECVNARI
jgi:ribonuclease PH